MGVAGRGKGKTLLHLTAAQGALKNANKVRSKLCPGQREKTGSIIGRGREIQMSERCFS